MHSVRDLAQKQLAAHLHKEERVVAATVPVSMNRANALPDVDSFQVARTSEGRVFLILWTDLTTPKAFILELPFHQNVITLDERLQAFK
jgi:hypothetical protein